MRADDEGQARVYDHPAADPAGVLSPRRDGGACDPIEDVVLALYLANAQHRGKVNQPGNGLRFRRPFDYRISSSAAIA
ncbi:MAG: hypothetical protein H0U86_00975 [Chloroflexi bacterium]|nr:hypothetical protein [Chloroflexota bacterium]